MPLKSLSNVERRLNILTANIDYWQGMPHEYYHDSRSDDLGQIVIAKVSRLPVRRSSVFLSDRLIIMPLCQTRQLDDALNSLLHKACLYCKEATMYILRLIVVVSKQCRLRNISWCPRRVLRRNELLCSCEYEASRQISKGADLM
jgi:hypothetical protein